MDFRFDFFTIIGFMGVLQGMILTLFLLRFNPKITPQNRILALLIGVFSFASFGAVVYYLHIIYYIPWFIRVHSPFVFLIAPLMYLYIKMMQKRRIVRLRELEIIS